MTRKSKLTTGTGGDTPRAMVGVTAENYIIRADKFENATGKAMEYAHAAGASFMIYPDMHAERGAWMVYYRIKGMKKQRKAMAAWLERGVPSIHGINEYRWAVPAQWPWDFDQSVDREMCGAKAP